MVKRKDEKTVDEIAAEIEAELLSKLTCAVNPGTGEVTCVITEEQWAALEKLPNKPQRLVFELSSTLKE